MASGRKALEEAEAGVVEAERAARAIRDAIVAG